MPSIVFSKKISILQIDNSTLGLLAPVDIDLYSYVVVQEGPRTDYRREHFSQFVTHI